MDALNMAPPDMDPQYDLRRPSGLTAFGVLNIVFAILGLLGGLAMLSISDEARRMSRHADEFEEAADRAIDRDTSTPYGQRETTRTLTRGMGEQMRAYSPGAFKLMFGLGLSGGVLLLISAFGLFGQRKLSGRTFANVAAVLLILCAIVSITKLGILFMGIPMCGAVYAIVLLACINTMYPKRLVN
jgi:hypothetical protein